MPVRRGRKKKWHGGSALLNKVGFHSTAAICCIVEDTSTWTSGKDSNGDMISTWSQPSYTFQISNCDRSLTWDLDFETPASRANDLHKLDLMISVLSDFRDGVAVEQERLVQRLARL